MLLLLLSLAASAGDSLPFRAKVLGSTIGLGDWCVIDDPPPRGGWTMVLEVTDPQQTGLAAGRQICVIVHSPSLYASAVLEDEREVGCRLAVPADLERPRFTCGAAPPPAASLPLFDPSAIPTLRLDARQEERAAKLLELRGKADALDAALRQNARCPALIEAGAVGFGRSILDQARSALDAGEGGAAADLLPFVDDALAEIDRLKLRCPDAPAGP